ncbi:MAG TPA: Rieske (2Fe-2S) protein [Rhodopila sp.]|uniref:Rieske (2Fe-2S) protein n=1 Tax=Rhodopila sp. TaxID=2480087 RepID=UPI002B7B61C6|nr:Rieske (2Fe-2S) protein [Rhodopila sp.]HVY14028.1 Rieske (2Fe-2S) protein [Rhodopila sp.]
MSMLIPPRFRPLCRVDAIPDGGAKGFPGGPGYTPGLIAVRQGEQVLVYENACPHIGTPLDWVQGQFFSTDGRYLICATHGAAFEPATGECVAGPCRGDFLTAVPSEIRDGLVLIDRPA